MICKATPEKHTITVEEFDSVFIEDIGYYHGVLYRRFDIRDINERQDIVQSFYIYGRQYIAEKCKIQVVNLHGILVYWLKKFAVEYFKKNRMLRFLDTEVMKIRREFSCPAPREKEDFEIREEAQRTATIEKIMELAQWPDIIRCYYLEGWMADELAEEYGMSDQGIYNKIKRDFKRITTAMGLPDTGKVIHCQFDTQEKRFSGRPKHKRTGEKKGLSVVCAGCGETFITTMTKQKTCSQRCRNDVDNARRRKPERIIACEQCGKTVTTHNPRVKFCSDECQKQWWGQKARENHQELRSRDVVCQECGNVFTTTNSIKKFCCRACGCKYKSRKASREAAMV